MSETPGSVRLLFVADVFAQPGYNALREHLPGIREAFEPDLVVVNGENSAEGRGITAQIAEAFFGLGVDVITGGNHIFDKGHFGPLTERFPTLLRPLNYPTQTAGRGWVSVKGRNGVEVAVVSLQGRVFMPPIDCPFRTLESMLDTITSQTPVIFIDFHAETTAEKQALARYFDGRVSAIVGTHTHVQTADEKIFPNGTGFITDAGMTGASNSVIGNEIGPSIERLILQIPVPQKPAKGARMLNAVIVDLATGTTRCNSIERINLT